MSVRRFTPPPAAQFSARTSSTPRDTPGYAATIAAGAPVWALMNGRAMIWLPPKSDATVSPFLLLLMKKKSPSSPVVCVSSSQIPPVRRKPPRNSLLTRSLGKRTSVPGFGMMPAKFSGVPGGEAVMAGETLCPVVAQSKSSRRVQTRPDG